MDQATQTQLSNIEKRTGKSVDQLLALVKNSSLKKHGELRDMLKSDHGMGHGDANLIVHLALQSDGATAAVASGATTDDVLDEIYSGPKAALRPIHDALMNVITPLGDFEIAPKKGYVSLRRKKQFAMIGPATNSRVELGLNMKGVPGTDKLLEQPAGGMCQYKVKLTDPGEVDNEVAGWIKIAFDGAG